MYPSAEKRAAESHACTRVKIQRGARAQRAMHAPVCVWEGVFYKCALNLRLNKYVWTAVNYFKSLWTQKATLEVDGLN